MNWSRRRFLATGASCWFLAGRSKGEDQGDSGGPVVLHTTDLHGHILPTVSYEGEDDLGGLARCAHQIRQWRKASPENLLLDIGDVYQGTLVSWRNRGRLMIELFNKMGYDAWTVGNHEFDWGPEVLEDAINRSQMPVLAANVKLDGKLVEPERTEGLFQKLRPWILKEVAGEKIGVVGLITPGLSAWLRQELLGPLEAVDPGPVLARCVKELKSEGATKIIVAGHMGWREGGDDYANPLGETLAQSGVDLYLGGHSHRRNVSWEKQGITCTQASYHGLDCGCVHFENGKAVPHLERMTSEIPFDTLVMEAAAKELEEAKTENERVITVLEKPIAGKEEVRELMAASFAKAAEKQGAEVDTVFHGTFGSTGIPAGPVTVEMAWEVLPYENGLVYAELTEEELLAILSESEGDRYSDRKLIGMEVTRDEHKKPVALKPEQGPRRERYRVVMNSYDAQSGGRRMPHLPEILAKKTSRSRLLPMDTREAFIDHLADL